MPEEKKSARENAQASYQQTPNLISPKNFGKIDDQSKFFANATAANDNQKEEAEAKPKSQRGGEPVKRPQVVSENIANTYSPQIRELVEDPTALARKRAQEEKQNQNEEVVPEQNREINIGENFPNEEYLPEVEEQIINQPEQSNLEKPDKIVAYPPVLMLTVALGEYFAILILGIIGLVLSFLVPPMGLMIDIGIYVWKIIFAGIVFAWSFYYDSQTTAQIQKGKERMKNMRDKMNRAKKIQSIVGDKRKMELLEKISKKSLGRGALLALNVFPAFDVLIPINVIIVSRTFLSKKKSIEEYNKSVDDLNF